MGFLYAGKYLGDGKLLFCPSLTDTASAFSAAHYFPCLTTPALPENPFIRTSYLFNPKVVNAPSNNKRLYQKNQPDGGA